MRIEKPGAVHDDGLERREGLRRRAVELEVSTAPLAWSRKLKLVSGLVDLFARRRKLHGFTSLTIRAQVPVRTDALRAGVANFCITRLSVTGGSIAELCVLVPFAELTECAPSMSSANDREVPAAQIDPLAHSFASPTLQAAGNFTVRGLYDSPSDPFGDLWDDGVSESFKSVHPRRFASRPGLVQPSRSAVACKKL
jgi:hypothetical protein